MAGVVVRAVLSFEGPHITWKRAVNWPYYELKAMLTKSDTSDKAHRLFMEHGEKIIASSEKELKNLTSIQFFETDDDKYTLLSAKRKKTPKIKIVRDDDGKIKNVVQI